VLLCWLPETKISSDSRCSRFSHCSFSPIVVYERCLHTSTAWRRQCSPSSPVLVFERSARIAHPPPTQHTTPVSQTNPPHHHPPHPPPPPPHPQQNTSTPHHTPPPTPPHPHPQFFGGNLAMKGFPVTEPGLPWYVFPSATSKLLKVDTRLIFLSCLSSP